MANETEKAVVGSTADDKVSSKKKVTSVEFPLEFPVTYDGREIKTLTFRRMRAGDALIAEATESDIMAGFVLFAELAGVDVDVIKLLDNEDMENITLALVPLMGKQSAAAMEAAAREFVGET